MRCSNNSIIRVLICLIVAFLFSLLYSVVNIPGMLSLPFPYRLNYLIFINTLTLLMYFLPIAVSPQWDHVDNNHYHAPGFSVNYGEMLRGNRFITLSVSTTTSDPGTTDYTEFQTIGDGGVPSLPSPPFPSVGPAAACATTFIGPYWTTDDYGFLCRSLDVDFGDTMCCHPLAGNLYWDHTLENSFIISCFGYSYIPSTHDYCRNYVH